MSGGSWSGDFIRRKGTLDKEGDKEKEGESGKRSFNITIKRNRVKLTRNKPSSR